MTHEGPLLLHPRLDPKPWGGHRLARFGFDLPEEPIGEAVVTADDAVIQRGKSDRSTLGDVVRQDPGSVIGDRGLAVTGGRPLFPLLIKLIDASEHLSIQDHPDDTQAASLNSLGKTEAWHVLDATPGSVLFIGLRPEASLDDFAPACRERTGEAARFLNHIPAIPGQTVLIPAGTVHALGAGVVVYEVQQPSAITYRLDDWGRVDVQGNSRDLHIHDGLAALKPSLRPEVIPPVSLIGLRRRQLIAACRYFAVERIELDPGEALPVTTSESAHALTCLDGLVDVTADSIRAKLPMGQTAVILARSTGGEVMAAAPSVLLHAWVPDLASDVVGVACAAGATNEEIGRLAGPLTDVRDELRGTD